MNEILENQIKRNLSDFLKYYMQEYHLSRKELSQITGLSLSTIRNYLDQEALPFPDALFLIQVSCHVDIIQIIGLSQNEKMIQERIRELNTIKDEIDQLMDRIIAVSNVQNKNQHAFNYQEPPLHRSLYHLPVPVIDPTKDFKLEGKNAFRKNISDMIREFVKENNLNYVDFARMVGVHKSKITAYVKMNSTPALPTLMAMAEVMQIPMNLFFLSREDNEAIHVFESVRKDLSLYYAFVTNKESTQNNKEERNQ